jgi:hypothetical protein
LAAIHLGWSSDNLAGVMYILGHKQPAIWNVASGSPRARVPTIPYRPLSVSYSTEGTAIAVGLWNCGKVLICPPIDRSTPEDKTPNR